MHGTCTARARHVHGMCMCMACACACARHVHVHGMCMCMACAWHVYGVCTACALHVHGMGTAWASSSSSLRLAQVPTIQIFDGAGINRLANLDCQPAQFKQARAVRGMWPGTHAWYNTRGTRTARCLPAYLLGGANDCGDDRGEDAAAGASRCRDGGRRDGARSRPARAWPRQE